MKTFLLVLLAFILATTTALKFTKISEDVQRQLSLKNNQADIFIEFNEQVNFNNEIDSLNKMDEKTRGRYVLEKLMTTAFVSQTSMREYLGKQGVSFKSFYIDNTILVKDASKKLIENLSLMKGVKVISLNKKIDPSEFIEVPNETKDTKKSSDKAVEWNVEWVKAPEVWKQGHFGEGIIIANSDTGVIATHPSLSKTYLGAGGNHNFNWYDPSTRGSSRTPVDTNGHGTHCMGTKVGLDGNNEIGVAPKSKWIACRSLGPGASRATVVGCLQFFLAPHDLDGRNANPDKRPHVTSHSYLCNGCQTQQAVAALRAAGVMVVVANGNSGSRCSTTTEPARWPESLGVGALNTRSDTIATFSSRGPVGSLLKPDVSAPGVAVRSAFGATGYRSLSGTSMACPAVAGVVALLWDAVPQLKRNIDETIKIIKESSKGQESSQCDPQSQSPNNVYGYGTVNAAEAVKIAKLRFN